MNKAKEMRPTGILGVFSASGFFTKNPVRPNKPSQNVFRTRYDAATPAQSARLCGVHERTLAKQPRD